ncbi:MAG: hypothetical protein IPQ01_16570 [Zoogloea sp.]|jgi:hypothetical protein|nr:hypothetical protein [Zoogloea sp.]
MDRTQESQAFPTSAAAHPAAPAFPAISSAAALSLSLCRLDGAELVVAPFRINRFRQAYLNPDEIRIELAAIAPGHYRVMAVHNFHVEDCNPCLDECVAGLFLAAQLDDGSWEEPERFPVECRAVAVLATLRVPDGNGPAELLA